MKPDDAFDEARLLSAFQKKDDVKAFETIYKYYWFKLYSWACSQTGSRQDAEEMVQIIFERLWKNRRRTEINNLGAYLAVSLRNIISDYHRIQARIKEMRENYVHDPAHNTTEEEINRKLLIQLLEDTLQELPFKTQTVFRMSRYDHKSVREIAHDMKLTEKAVEYHITKALKLIRMRLKAYLHLLF